MQERNQKTGTSMRCWKIYNPVGNFGGGNDTQVQAMIDLGVQALIRVKRWITPSPAIAPPCPHF